jgi:F-type H+-transporting ATPase subunit epsilon
VARTKFEVEVLTPEGEVFAEEVEMVSTRTAVGSIGILANHEPVLAMLDPTELRLYKSESDVVRFAQAEGYLQVAEGRVLLLVQEAHESSALNAEELREHLQHAERELEEAGEDTERRRVAERDQRRWQTFLEIAESG